MINKRFLKSNVKEMGRKSLKPGPWSLFKAIK
jgi:hypothetical protein